MRGLTSVRLLGMSGPLLLAAAATADFTGMVTEVKDIGDTSGWLDPTLDLLAINVYTQFDDPLDIGRAIIGLPGFPVMAHVENGLFYHHELGSAVRPSAGLVAMFPSLAYDSFLTINTKTSDDGGAPNVHHLVQFVPEQLLIYNGGWWVYEGDPLGSPDASGRVLIAQFTVDLAATPNATGINGQLIVYWTDPEDGMVQSPLTFHHAIPVPGALPILAAAALRGRHRRRPR